MQDTAMVRNIALIGHGNSGKTSLAEAMLYTAGKIKRLGQVDDGTASLDFDGEEIKRKITINASFQNYTWNKVETYFIDTPVMIHSLTKRFLPPVSVTVQFSPSARFSV